jgi:hypothetical protein
VKQLIALGCDRDPKNVQGHGPVWEATRNSHEEVAVFLLGLVEEEEVDTVAGGEGDEDVLAEEEQDGIADEETKKEIASHFDMKE